MTDFSLFRPNYEEPSNTGAKSHDTYETLQKTPEKLRTPGSPMESIRRRHMSQFRAGNEPAQYRTCNQPESGYAGTQQQAAFRKSGSDQTYISGNETYRQTTGSQTKQSYNTGSQAQTGYSGTQQQPVFTGNQQQATGYSGNQSQTGYQTGTKPQSPLVAVPIIETHVGMKRPPSVHPMEYPVSADAYPDPGEI